MSPTSRERVLTVFNRQSADRPALDLGSRISSIAVDTYNELKNILDLNKPTEVLDKRLNIARIDDEILTDFGVDARYVYIKPPAAWIPPDPEAETYVDDWGAGLHRPKGGFYYDHVDHPVKAPTPEALAAYTFPDPDDPTRYAGLREEAKALQQAGYAVGTVIKGVQETVWTLRGFQDALTDTGFHPKFYQALSEATADVLARMMTNFFNEVGPYVDFFCLTCDLGTQNNLMISPKTYRELIRPHEMTVYQAVRKAAPHVFIAQHSCGAIFKLIPDIIEAGVQVLNPIQTSARGMDLARLKKEYGTDLAFWGSMDVQQVLVNGTPDQVAAEVRRSIAELGAGGGLMLGPSHDIQALTPPNNIVTLYRTAARPAD